MTHHALDASAMGVTKDTFLIDFNTLFLLSTTTDPDKLNFGFAEYRAGGIIFGSAWRNIVAMAAVSHA